MQGNENLGLNQKNFKLRLLKIWTDILRIWIWFYWDFNECNWKFISGMSRKFFDMAKDRKQNRIWFRRISSSGWLDASVSSWFLFLHSKSLVLLFLILISGTENSMTINWMWLHRDHPQRCECGYHFKLVDADPESIDSYATNVKVDY